MKTKRILSFLMSLVMVLSVFSGLGISAAAWDANNAPHPSISASYDRQTKELRVDISLENMAKMDSADIFLEYDSDVLEYVDCTTYEEELDDDVTVEAGSSEAGQVSAVIMTSSEQFYVDSINLATFIFRKIDADTTTTTISLGSESNISGMLLGGSRFLVNIPDPADDDENADDNLIVVSKYSDITNKVTIDIYVRAKETSEIFLTYPDDTLEVADIQPGINYTGVMNAADITEDGRYFSAVSAVLDDYEGGIIHAATYTFNKIDDSKYVYLFTGEESAIDGEPVYGEFKIPLVNQKQDGNVTLETSYDEETDRITVDVYADDVEETASIFFDYSHKDFRFVSAEADDSNDKIKTVAGVTADENEYLSCSATFSVNENSNADYYGEYKFEPQTFTIDVHPELPVCEHKNTYTVEGVPPDCYSEGKTEEITCRDCGYVLKDSRFLNPLFHNFIDGFCEYCGMDEKPLRYDSDFSRYISFSEYDEFTLITLKPMSPDGTAASQFRKMLSDEVELPVDGDTAVPCGMSFIHRGRGYITTVWGDVNADGRITAADARIILRLAAKLEPDDAFIMTACDYNQNYIIEASEARATLRYAARLSKTLY